VTFRILYIDPGGRLDAADLIGVQAFCFWHGTFLSEQSVLLIRTGPREGVRHGNGYDVSSIFKNLSSLMRTACC
jgi:hypothetical protein